MFVVKEGSTSTQHSCAPLLVQTVRLVLFCGHSLSHSIKMFPFSYRTFMGPIYSNKGGRCSNCSQNFVSPRKRSQEESYQRTSLVSFTWMTEFDSSSKFIMRPSTANTHSRYLGVPTSAHPSCAQRREKCDQLRGSALLGEAQTHLTGAIFRGSRAENAAIGSHQASLPPAVSRLASTHCTLPSALGWLHLHTGSP